MTLETSPQTPLYDTLRHERLKCDQGIAAALAGAGEPLPDTTTYTVVVCDIDGMGLINKATGSWDTTDLYLAGGLAVRYGEIAGQLHQKGDEFCFVLDDQARERETDPDGFVGRITLQLAGQPIPISATFAIESGVRAAQVPSAVARLSDEVLSLKAQRDGRVKVAP
jgi:hypothetical protein